MIEECSDLGKECEDQEIEAQRARILFLTLRLVNSNKEEFYLLRSNVLWSRLHLKVVTPMNLSSKH